MKSCSVNNTLMSRKKLLRDNTQEYRSFHTNSTPLLVGGPAEFPPEGFYHWNDQQKKTNIVRANSHTY